MRYVLRVTDPGSWSRVSALKLLPLTMRRLRGGSALPKAPGSSGPYGSSQSVSDIVTAVGNPRVIPPNVDVCKSLASQLMRSLVCRPGVAEWSSFSNHLAAVGPTHDLPLPVGTA